MELLGTGPVKKVEGGHDGLNDELVPEVVNGEILVQVAKAYDEVILQRLDDSFGGVASVATSRWHELEVDAFFTKEGFELVGAFVVKTLKLWAKASCA